MIFHIKFLLVTFFYNSGKMHLSMQMNLITQEKIEIKFLNICMYVYTCKYISFFNIFQGIIHSFYHLDNVNQIFKIFQDKNTIYEKITQC